MAIVEIEELDEAFLRGHPGPELIDLTTELNNTRSDLGGSEPGIFGRDQVPVPQTRNYWSRDRCQHPQRSHSTNGPPRRRGRSKGAGTPRTTVDVSTRYQRRCDVPPSERSSRPNRTRPHGVRCNRRTRTGPVHDNAGRLASPLVGPIMARSRGAVEVRGAERMQRTAAAAGGSVLKAVGRFWAADLRVAGHFGDGAFPVPRRTGPVIHRPADCWC